MKDTGYHELIDTLYIAITEALDDYKVDIDCVCEGGILSLTKRKHTKTNLNKQPPLQQLWVATKFNDHHFDLTHDVWFDERTSAEFYGFFDEAVGKQAGEPLQLNLQGEKNDTRISA